LNTIFFVFNANKYQTAQIRKEPMLMNSRGKCNRRSYKKPSKCITTNKPLMRIAMFLKIHMMCSTRYFCSPLRIWGSLISSVHLLIP